MRSPLRVLITTPNLDTAGSKYVLGDLITGLDRSNVIPSLCVQRVTNTAYENELKLYVDSFFEMPLRMPIRPSSTFFRRTSQLASQLRGRFDIIHSFDYASVWSEGLIAYQASIPWVMVKTNMSWNKRNWWIRCLLAKKIVLYSEAQYKQLFERTFFAKRSVIINIGININKFIHGNYTESAALIKDQIGIPPQAIVLGCVAHLIPVKGHSELIRAFAQARTNSPPAYLALVGGGSVTYEEHLRCIAKEEGISDFVHFLGPRDDVPQLLQAFDGLILATRNWGRKEAFGAVLIEAMASGLPVIATKSGGPENIVVPGETGWLVEADGVEPLAGAIRDFLSNENKRCAFGNAGLMRAHKFFSSEQMVNKYQELYYNLTSENNRI